MTHYSLRTDKETKTNADTIFMLVKFTSTAKIIWFNCQLFWLSSVRNSPNAYLSLQKTKNCVEYFCFLVTITFIDRMGFILMFFQRIILSFCALFTSNSTALYPKCISNCLLLSAICDWLFKETPKWFYTFDINKDYFFLQKITRYKSDRTIPFLFFFSFLWIAICNGLQNFNDFLNSFFSIQIVGIFHSCACVCVCANWACGKRQWNKMKLKLLSLDWRGAKKW